MASADGSDKGYNDKEWKGIQDREERRRIQNRNAQRRHRDRRRQEDEEKQRIATHQESAGSAYTPASFEEVNQANPEGLPWGAFSLTSRDMPTSNTSTPFSSPELSTGEYKTSHEAAWGNRPPANSAAGSSQLEVPQLNHRGLASSTSVPQLRDAAMRSDTEFGTSLTRSRSSANTALKRKQEDA